jgi:DNA-binding response OmpR family regulator
MIKVMLLDDDTDLLDMVCLMLSVPEMKPYCFDDCKQFMPVLEAETFDIVVMDVFLGECDGRSLCKQVKSMKEYSSLPVLLYSAGNISDASIRESGADYFLQKPFDMHVLLEQIQTLAKRKTS